MKRKIVPHLAFALAVLMAGGLAILAPGLARGAHPQTASGLPDVIRGPGGRGYVWQSAEGELPPAIPADLFAALTSAQATGQECIPQILKKEGGNVDTSWPANLAAFVAGAKAVLVGTVTAVEPGFLFDGEAGVMLTVAVDSRPKPSRKFRGDILYVFYPKGEVPVDHRVICRLNGQLPSPPAVGESVVFAPRRGPLHPSPAISELLGTGVELLVASGGRMRVPTGLAAIEELRTGDLVPFDEVVRRIRSASRRDSEQ